MELIHTPIHPELLQASQDLLEGVQSGEILGLGLIVQLRGGKFFVDAVGRITKQPHSARGWLLALDDHLRDLAVHRNHGTTTI